MARTRFVTVMLIVGLVAAACADDVVIIGDPGSGRVCEIGQCDTFEATVSSIDWLGDGTSPDKIQSSYGVQAGVPLRTDLGYEGLADAEADWEQTMARLRDAGFSIPVDGSAVHADGDEWRIRGRVLDGYSPPMLEVTVDMVDDDARAAEILAPIVDALGAIP